jgi:MOSC domain-containing protein YiiM
MASVVSVNVGKPSSIPRQAAVSAINKCSVAGPVGVRPLGLAGDDQADKHSHGGPEQAVYAFATEDLDDWAAILDRELRHGQFGENLSTGGVDVTGAVIGEIWHIGTAVLQVTRPRIPCVVFQNWLGEPHWVKRFTHDGRPGAYLRVLQTGELSPGDDITIDERPNHGITIGLTFRALTTERNLLPRLLDAPQLPEDIHTLAGQYAASLSQNVRGD